MLAACGSSRHAIAAASCMLHTAEGPTVRIHDHDPDTDSTDTEDNTGIAVCSSFREMAKSKQQVAHMGAGVLSQTV